MPTIINVQPAFFITYPRSKDTESREHGEGIRPT
jgi:hypothetical protein